MSESNLNPAPIEQTQTPTPPAAATAAAPARVIKEEDHERALADMIKYKKENDALKAAQKASKEEQMRKNQEFEQLANQYAKERDEVLQKLSAKDKAILDGERMRALQAEVTKLGIHPDALKDLDIVDLEGIQVETTSLGKVNVLNAKTFAERLKMQRPHWFTAGKTNLNTGTPGISAEAGPVTPQQVYAAEKAFRTSGKAEDQQKYQELMKKLREQPRS